MRRYLFATIVLIFHSQLNAVAIIGGRDNDNDEPYAALVSPSGVATEITGEVPMGTGFVNSVAINSSGAAIIGGRDNFNSPYAALVSPAGVATEITGEAPMGIGQIVSVAINSSGAAIIGGSDNFGSPYAALVSPAGVATEITGAVLMGTGFINSVAINSSGAAVIGGEDNNSGTPYASLVSPSGVATEITGEVPMGFGLIRSVAINSSGVAIIGGQINDSSGPYVALVSPSGIATEITGEVPMGAGLINSVAINSSGAAIIGGQDNNGRDPYAALVSPSGIATEITGEVPMGIGLIASVAIDSSGVAIIGGRVNDNDEPYVALVSPSGIATKITGETPMGIGQIVSVAIDSSGVAIIGGGVNDNDEPYVALVSPSGIATKITGETPMGDGFIFSVAVALNDTNDLLNAVVPTSFGSGSSFANSLFALSSQILPNHLSSHKPMWENTLMHAQFGEEVGLLADASQQDQWHTPQKTRLNDSKPQCPKKTNYSLWAAPFGDYAHQQSEGGFSAIDNWIAGFLAAFDYHGIRNTTIGCGIAYAFNYADLSQGEGYAKAHQELLTLYGSWIRKNFYINLALWGGLYQTHNERHSIAGITSTSNFDGWLLNPHLEISTPFYAKGWFLIDPFAMFDWANNWQEHVNETGPSGFNLIIGPQYTSLLRSEAGLRFFESLIYGWGTFLLMEKASWVNKKPFNAGSVQTSFVGSISAFSIETFSNRTQNLGAVQLNARFVPCNTKYPYGSINYQGEFGSSFQNHLISLEIGMNF